jgi:S1-C subfamily serine protease
VIRDVDQKSVKSATEFASAVRGARKDGSVLLLVERGGQHLFIGVKTAGKSRG